MLTKEQIDLQNQEGIEFLRNGLVEILEKMRLSCSKEITEARERLSNLNKKHDKLDPDKMERSRTIRSNILFFIGSIFNPAATPSEWFGKQKISEDKKELIHKARKLNSDFQNFDSNAIKYKSSAVVLFDRIIMDIKNTDVALVDLINEISLHKKDNNLTMYQWISFFEAFIQCKYLPEEEYDHMWRYATSSYDSMTDFVKLCSDYAMQYGSGTNQNGR